MKSVIFLVIIIPFFSLYAREDSSSLKIFSFLRGSRAPAYRSSQEAWSGLTLSTGAVLESEGSVSSDDMTDASIYSLKFLWDAELLGALNFIQEPPDWTYERCTENDCNRKKDASYYFLPGKNLYAGIGCGGDFCEIRIGRTEMLPYFTGGSAAGLHLHFKTENAGSLLLSAAYDPAASDDGYSITQPGSSVQEINFSHINFHGSRPFFSASDAVAHSISWQSTWYPFYTGVSFETSGFRTRNTKTDTLSADGKEEEYQRYFIKRTDHFTAIAGIHFTGTDWMTLAGVEFSQLTGSAASRWKTYSRSPYKISGQALSARARVHYRWLDAGTEFFLPEPAVRKGGSKGDDTEKSGYLLIGKNPLRSWIAGGLMDLRPAPGYCNSADCLGPYSETRGLFGFRTHAAVASLYMSLDIKNIQLKNEIYIIKPLKTRTDDHRSPWRNLTPDPEKEHYYELNTSLVFSAHTGLSVFLRYARLHRKNPSYGVRLAAEDMTAGVLIQPDFLNQR